MKLNLLFINKVYYIEIKRSVHHEKNADFAGVRKKMELWPCCVQTPLKKLCVLRMH